MMSDGAGRAIGHGSFRHANRPPEAGPMPAATAGKHLRLCPPRPRLPQVAGGPPAQTEPEPIMSGTTRTLRQARIELPHVKQQPKAAPVPAATTAASLRPCLPSPRRHQVRGERPAGKQGRAGCAPRKRWCVATFVEMMACAFVPARAVVGGKSAAVGAHAPQVLRAPEPDENAAAEGKPPRRHLLGSQHVEDAGRVMDVAAGSHLPTRARASAFGACAAPLRSAPPLSCSAGCSQRRKKPVQKCRWPCALGRGGEAPPRYPASPPSGPTPRRLKQARRCTTRPAGRHTSAVRQPAQSPGKSSRRSSEGMHARDTGLRACEPRVRAV